MDHRKIYHCFIFILFYFFNKKKNLFYFIVGFNLIYCLRYSFSLDFWSLLYKCQSTLCVSVMSDLAGEDDGKGKTCVVGAKQQGESVSIPATVYKEQERESTWGVSDWMGGSPVCDLHGAAAQCRPLALLFLLQRMSSLHVRHELSPLQLFQAVP